MKLGPIELTTFLPQFYEYYDKFESAISRNDKDSAERWARQFIWEVARLVVS